MPLTLTPEIQRMVEDKQKEGTYHSADQVVQAAIQALNERDLLALDEETLDAIDRGEHAIERGKVHILEDVVDEIRAMSLPKSS